MITFRDGDWATIRFRKPSRSGINDQNCVEVDSLSEQWAEPGD